MSNAKGDRDDVPPPPESTEPAPWFGYIGILLAIASMIVGMVLVVVAAIYLIHWFGR